MPANFPRKLIVLVESLDHVCYRYRLAAFAPALARHGWQIEPIVCPRGPAAVWQARAAIAAADAVVLQRRLIPLWHTMLLRRDAKTLIFDIDDAVFHRDNNSRRPTRSWQRERRFQALMRRVDAVTAGNRFLLAKCDQAADAAKSLFMPTCMDDRNPTRAAPSDRTTDIRLVWVGSRSTASSLLQVHQALQLAQQRVPGLQLRMLSDRFPALPGVNTVEIPWSPAAEAAELSAADIGIACLPEHPWSKGKCGLKVIQYMAAGLPVIANPFGVHREMIQPDVSGLLATTPDEWADAIQTLASSPRQRASMGAAGRATYEQSYSVTAWEEVWCELLDRLTGDQQQRSRRRPTQRHPAATQIAASQAARRA